MADYVDKKLFASYLKSLMNEFPVEEDENKEFNLGLHQGLIFAINDLKKFQSADVQPVKHGRWIDKNPQDKYDPRCICSVCGSVEFPLSRHNYCPNCGAKMDGAE